MAGRRRTTALPVARAVAACLTGAAVLSACDASTGDPLQVADTLRAATPAVSPPAATPAGHVYPLTTGAGAGAGAGAANATAAAFDAATGTLAVAVTAPDRVLLYRLADFVAAGTAGPPAAPGAAAPGTAAPGTTALGTTALGTTAPGTTAPGTTALGTAAPDAAAPENAALGNAAPRTVDLPAATDQIDASTPGQLLVAAAGAGVLLKIDASTGATHTIKLDGRPAAAITVGDDTVVALADRVLVLDEKDQVRHTVGGFAGAADVVAAGGRAAVLDRLRTALYSVDAGAGRLGPGLRAGNGATNAVGDRFGRVLVTDTRDGELLAFTADPMIMRQRYPVPGAPYAIAYDARHDLAWVTLTERNEVVGFDVAGGEPVERYRLATVRQPNAIAVDGGSGPHGTVVVVSGAGEGIQVVQP